MRISHQRVTYRTSRPYLQKFILLFVAFVCGKQLIAQPTINSFSPVYGQVGTTVTINGTNFSPIISDNTVYFGGVKAIVTNATTTALTTITPAGATNDPITVTVNGLTVSSWKPFSVSFPDGGPLVRSSFSSPVDSSANDFPSFIAQGDVDGDGKPDLVVTTQSACSISRNTGSSGIISFASKIDLALNNNAFTRKAVLTDMDGDGRLDIVVINSSPSQAYVSVFQNLSTPGSVLLAPRVDYAVNGYTPWGLATGDLDGDGKPEMVVTALYAASFAIFKNTSSIGSISFAPRVDSSLQGNPQGLTISDLNDDNKPEIIITLPAYNTLSVFRNTSSGGTMSFAPKVGASTYGAIDVYTSDLDSDGRPDLVATNPSTAGISINRSTCIGDTIRFDPRFEVGTGFAPDMIAIGDMDGDSKTDLVWTASFTDMAIYKNTTIGSSITFSSNVIGVGKSAHSVTLGDYDGDGKLDIATTNSSSPSTISILRNKVTDPFISSFTPGAGGPGTVMSISGYNFTGASAVTVGGIPVSSFAVISPTSITASIASGSASGSVTVVTSYGTSSLERFVFPGQVKIASVGPLSGTVGSTVIINGLNFNPVAANNIVYFGPVKATVTNSTGNTLSVKVPSCTGYQPITVIAYDLMATSNQKFNVTFEGGGSITPNSFAAKLDVNAGNNPFATALADLDGDGLTDMIAVNYNNTYSIFKNNSLGQNIVFAPKVDGPAINGTKCLAIGDLDADGKPDLITGLVNSSFLSIYRNISTPGNISFAPKVMLLAPNYPQTIQTGDLDGDGLADIAVTSVNGNSFSFLRNICTATGMIAFATGQEIYIGDATFPGPFSIGDLDGDDKPDVAMILSGNSKVSFFRNTSSIGTITFASRIDSSGFYQPAALKMGDVDGDGKTDVVVCNAGGHTFSIMRNTATPGTIAFAPRVDTAVGGIDNYVDLGDVDGDGKPDIAATNISTNKVALFRNTSTPGIVSLSPKTEFATGTYPFHVVINDLNGDGKPEIITSNSQGNSLSLFLNKSGLIVAQLCPSMSGITITSDITGTTYQWQQDTGSGFIDIANNAHFTGASTLTLNLTNIPSSWSGYRYRCVVNGNNSSTFQLRFINTWTGTVNSSWNDPGNWSCGVVPDNSTDVVINSGTVVLNSSLTIRTLTLAPGVVFLVSPGVILTITN